MELAHHDKCAVGCECFVLTRIITIEIWPFKDMPVAILKASRASAFGEVAGI